MNTPEEIFLQWEPSNEYDATWCSDQINDEDTKYIRADIVDQLRAELARIKPSWEDGITHRAMTHYGSWMYFESEPKPSSSFAGEWECDGDMYPAFMDNWKETLEERPE